MADTNIGSIIGSAVDNLKELAGTETVIGNPIITPNGTTVIPVSKISIGIASGGVDYQSKKPQAKSGKNFGGGGGTGVNIAPVAFLILSPDGKVELLPIASSGGNATVDKITSLIERSPDIIEKLKGVFVKKKPETNDVEQIAEDVVQAVEEAEEAAEAIAADVEANA